MCKINKFRRVGITGILIGLGVLFKIVGNEFFSNGLFILSTLIAGIPIVKQAVISLRYKVISIEFLVTVAITGAMFIQEYWEAAAVTFLFTFGAWLEERTLEKTRSSLKSLLSLSPLSANVRRENKEVTVPADEVKVLDTVIIRSGEKIPVDGKVLTGTAYVNQAVITGESKIIEKKQGDQVFSGTVLDHGYIEVETVKAGNDTSFARILELVEEAQDSKARTQKFLEKFSSFYTPSMIIFSILVYWITKDLHLALTFLVIACPGALVISAPVSLVAGIGNGAKRGILIKGGEIIEKTAKLDVIAFDKTGTLTIGEPRITKIRTFSTTENELLSIAAQIEAHSEHHLGKTIVKEAKERGIYQSSKVEDLMILKGRGVIGKLQGITYFIGNRRMLQENNILLENQVEEALLSEEKTGQTVILIATSSKVLGLLAISDQIRPEAKALISKLKDNGKKVVMLTGDNKHTALAFSQQLGIDEVYAELLPENKVSILKRFQSKDLSVAMVGDGINDAPAIATADVGIAMGGIGTDAAIETADVVLMNDNIRNLSSAIDIAEATYSNMKQNMFFSISVVLLLLVGVLTKKVFLASGMLIHEASVILVIVNALRLVHYRRKELQNETYEERYSHELQA